MYRRQHHVKLTQVTCEYIHISHIGSGVIRKGMRGTTMMFDFINSVSKNSYWNNISEWTPMAVWTIKFVFPAYIWKMSVHFKRTKNPSWEIIDQSRFCLTLIPHWKIQNKKKKIMLKAHLFMNIYQYGWKYREMYPQEITPIIFFFFFFFSSVKMCCFLARRISFSINLDSLAGTFFRSFPFVQSIEWINTCIVFPCLRCAVHITPLPIRYAEYFISNCQRIYTCDALQQFLRSLKRISQNSAKNFFYTRLRIYTYNAHNATCIKGRFYDWHMARHAFHRWLFLTQLMMSS